MTGSCQKHNMKMHENKCILCHYFKNIVHHKFELLQFETFRKKEITGERVQNGYNSIFVGHQFNFGMWPFQTFAVFISRLIWNRRIRKYKFANSDEEERTQSLEVSKVITKSLSRVASYT